MTSKLRVVILSIMVAAISGLAVLPAGATVHIFNCHDHPNGAVNPPTYGLRIDDLINAGEYTFSFDYPGASVMLTWDDVAGTINISGTAYGGRDIGGAWDGAEQGWIAIDFTYVDDVYTQETCAGGPGDDAYVTSESANNNGTITLIGWGGDAVFPFSGKADGTGCTFVFDNDTDSKGNAGIANDPSIYSASGWLMPPTSGSRDWLFIAEMATVPTETKSWGAVKSTFNK